MNGDETSTSALVIEGAGVKDSGSYNFDYKIISDNDECLYSIKKVRIKKITYKIS
jgi:hypothetical protein